MARRKKRKQPKIGYCSICGNHGELSFEHVPPKSAYNKETVIAYEWKDFLRQKTSKKTSKIQGGVGQHTLCESCNNKTGSWYGDEYVKWARICHDILIHLNKNKITTGTFVLKNVYPLRFLKEIVTCFFSVVGFNNAPIFANNYPDLVEFVLDKYSTTLPSGFRFFMNLYNYSDTGHTSLRRWSSVAKITVTENLTPLDSAIFDEIAHPPFELLMTIEDESISWATEITNFSQYNYDDKVDILISLKMKKSDSHLPGSG